ncbi:MAG TPA: carbohydrate kinase [Terriglobales bacterium]|nr:carbohydrate kinase [Terriglobales bacterium]
MSDEPRTVVGLGEVLWDMLPGGKQLGGAPTNFAYAANLLGDNSIVASRVGNDALGAEIQKKLELLGVNCTYLQQDEIHPTGTVEVALDASGQPQFTIAVNVAWDFLEWTSQWQKLAEHADVVCFGSLAQRSSLSQQTIRRFLEATRKEARRVYDVNLRQHFYDSQVLHESMRRAHVVKLNEHELPQVAAMLGVEGGSEESSARRLLEKYALKLVCVTKGADGSLLVARSGFARHPGFKVRVSDTVGAGDAFTACLAHYYVRGASLEEINDAANRLASWVASQPGGTPPLRGRTLEEVLAGVGAS